MFIEVGNVDDAINLNINLLVLFPSNFNYLFNLSYLYGENQEFEKCLNTLNELYSEHKNNIHVLNNLSYYNIQNKNFLEGEKFAREGLLYAKDSIWIGALLNNLGYSHFKNTNDIYESFDILNKSISFNINNPYVYFNIGLIYLELNEIDLCCLNINKANKLGAEKLTAYLIDKYCK